MNFIQNRKLQALLLILLGVLLSSCAGKQQTLDTGNLHSAITKETSGSGTKPKQKSRSDLSPSSSSKAAPEGPDYEVLNPLSGDVKQHIRTKGLAKRFEDEPSVTVSADELPLTDFVHRVFGKILQVNYVVGDKISKKDTVSLNLQKEISPRKLFKTVLDILEEHKVSVREKDGIFHIRPASDEQPVTIGRGGDLEDIPPTSGHVRQIVPLEYVQANNMRNIISLVPGTKVFSHPGENAVAVTGPREGVEQVLQYISIFDRPAMRGKYISKIRLKYMTPENLLPKLKEVLQAESIPLAGKPGQGGLQFITLDRWRLILVFAAEKKWLERVRYWTDILDKPQKADEKRYFIYFPENSRAVDLAQTLQSILGLAGQEFGQSGGSASEFSKSLYQSAGSGSGKVSASQERNTSTPEENKDPGQGELRGAPEIGGIAVDEARNALIVYAEAQKYKAIESLLKQLDIMPPQVLIEATVAEVTLVDDLRYGLEWYLKNTDGSKTSVLSTLDGLNLGSAGLHLSTLTDSEKFRLMINALAEEELVQVLSSPRVTVRDGKTANINVGTQVPVVTSETASVESATTEGTGVVRTYQYRDTGVILKISPTVHADELVTLEIAQEVSEVGASGTQNPSILNRTLTTDVVATAGQTLVIGGLIKQNKSSRDSKVPFFGDLPVIGNLFKTTSRSQERTELVVMITPHIIRSTQQVEDIRQSLFEKFHHLKAPEDKKE